MDFNITVKMTAAKKQTATQSMTLIVVTEALESAAPAEPPSLNRQPRPGRSLAHQMNAGHHAYSGFFR